MSPCFLPTKQVSQQALDSILVLVLVSLACNMPSCSNELSLSEALPHLPD